MNLDHEQTPVSFDVRRTYLNSPHYIGVFSASCHASMVIWNLGLHRFKNTYVLWEMREYWANSFIQLYITFYPEVSTCKSPNYRIIVNNESRTFWLYVRQSRQNIFLGYEMICDKTLQCAFATLMFIESLSYCSIDTMNVISKYAYESHNSVCKVKKYNKFKKVWSLQKLCSFLVDNMYCENRDYLKDMLPRSIYYSVTLHQNYLRSNYD